MNPNWKPGVSGNVNGRPKGVGNKNTEHIKQAFKDLLENNVENISIWLAKVAEKDPARATELVIKLSDFVVPKLARTEVTGNDGEDLFKNVSFNFNTANKDGESQESTPQEDSE
jgi:hypothetical protein